MIGGFEEPDGGTIEVGGKPVTGVPPYKREVNTVFQSYALFPHLNVFENVAFGLRRKKVPKDAADRDAHASCCASSGSRGSTSASRASSPAGSSSASRSRGRS